MGWQPIAEKEAERQLICDYAGRIDAEVVKLQNDDDDQGTDGIIQRKGKLLAIEARRKGFPNHSGKRCDFSRGWDSFFLVRDGGIFLNELTLRKHKDKNEGFIYLVHISGSPPRAASISLDRIDELLEQPYRTMRSTNSGNQQSVKTIPLNWFKEM